MRVLQHLIDLSKTRIAYPLNRWLTLYHFTGLIMVLTAIGLITQPAPSMVALDTLLKIPMTLLLSLFFTACGVILLVHPIDPFAYKVLLLPIYLYAAVSVWYTTTGQAGTWAGVITQLTIIGFLWIASTEPPKDNNGGNDRPAQSD